MADDGRLLLLLTKDHLGDGEPDLGLKLLRGFLSQLAAQQVPDRIICLNSGVFLTTAGSPVEAVLGQLEAQGSEVLSCGTCLSYYGRLDDLIVGRVGTMEETVSSMLAFDRVLQP
jgi:selenium metabolism protein YedF